MAVLGRMKSALDDAIDTVVKGINAVRNSPTAKTVSREVNNYAAQRVNNLGRPLTVTPAQKVIGQIQQDYQNWQAARQSRQAAQQQAVADLTHRILNTPVSAAKNTANYFSSNGDANPSTPKVDNIWNSPVLKAVERPLVGLQKGLETGNIVPKIQVKNPIGNAIVNAPGAIVNSIYGKGLTAPASDITKMEKNILQGKQLPQYSELNSPVVRLGYQIGSAMNPDSAKDLGITNTPQQFLGNVGGAAEPIINAWTFGKGVDLTKAAFFSGRPLLRTLVESGLSAIKPGVMATTAWSLDEYRNEKRLRDQLIKTGINAIVAVPTSIATGMGMALFGFGLNKAGQQFVRKFGTEAHTFLVNKDVLYRVATNQATPEELAFVKTLNGDARAAAARTPGGVEYTNFEMKQGPVWDFLRRAFPSWFDKAGNPVPGWSNPKTNPIVKTANNMLTVQPKTFDPVNFGIGKGFAQLPAKIGPTANESIQAIQQAMQKEVPGLAQLPSGGWITPPPQAPEPPAIQLPGPNAQEHPVIPDSLKTMPEGELPPAPTNEELAMQQLAQSRGYGGIEPPAPQTITKPTVQAKQYTNQLQQMKADTENQLQQVDKLMQIYDLYQHHLQQSNALKPDQVKPELIAQISQLNQDKQKIQTQLDYATSLLRNYDLVVQKIPNLMSPTELADHVQQLTNEINQIDTRIQEIGNSAASPTNYESALMNKDDLAEYRASLENDLETINRMLSTDAANETKQITVPGTSIEPPVPSNDELALKALFESRGYGGIPDPGTEMVAQPTTAAVQLKNQLTRMKEAVAQELAKVEDQIKHYDIYKGRQKLGNHPVQEPLTPDQQNQVNELKTYQDGLRGQIETVKATIRNYDLLVQVMPDLMPKSNLQALQKNLEDNVNLLDSKIDRIYEQAQTLRNPSAPLMQKSELRDLAKSLQKDAEIIDKLLASDIANETKQVEQPITDTVPTNEELALKALNDARGYSAPIEGMPEIPANPASIESPTPAETTPVVSSNQTPATSTTTPSESITANPTVEASTPVSAPTPAPGEKTRKLYNTVQENPTIPQDVKEEIPNNVDPNYTPKSEEQSMNEANQRIIDVIQQANDILSGKREVNPMKMDEYVADVIALSQKATELGQTQLAAQLHAHNIEMATSLGRSIDLYKVLKYSTPEGMLTYAQKLVDQANEKVSAKFMGALDRAFLTATGQPVHFELSQATKDFITQKTIEMQKMPKGEERNQAMDDILRKVSDDIPLTLSELYTAYRYNNMLSNPLSQLRNIYGNLLQLAGIKALTDINAVMIERLVARGATDREFTPEMIGDFYKAIGEAFPDAKTAARNSWAGKKDFSTQSEMKTIRQDKLPKWLTISGRALESMDMMFTTLVRAGVYAQEMAKPGADPVKALLYADKQADYFLFRNNPDTKNNSGQGNFLATVDKMANLVNGLRKIPLVGHFVPFFKVMVNIAKMQMEYSPIQAANILSGGIHGAGVVTDKKAKIYAGAKLLLGLETMAVGTLLAFAGLTHWKMSSDDQLKGAQYESGRGPGTVKLKTPFGSAWVPFTYFGPLALALAIPTAIKYYQTESETALSDNQLAKAGKTIAGLTNYFMTQTPISGLGSFLQAAEGNIDYNFGNSMAFTMGQNVIASGLLNYVGRVLDPVYRKANGFVEGFERQLPLLSKNLEPHTGLTGQPSTRNLTNYVLPYGIKADNPSFDGYMQSRQTELQNSAMVNQLKKEIDRGNNLSIAKMVENGTPMKSGVPTTGAIPVKSPTPTGSNIGVSDMPALNEKQVAGVKKKVDDLMGLYFSTTDETARQKIAETIGKLGVPFQNAMESYLTKDLKLENTKGLSDKTAGKIKRSNEYAYMRELRNKYQDLGVGDAFLNGEYQRLGIDPEDMIYDDKTILADDVQLDQIKSEIAGLTDKDLLSTLVAMRRVSEGSRKALLTDSLIGKLEDEKLISSGTADYLKTVGWDSETGTFKKLPGKTAKIKAFDVSVPKASTPKARQVKGMEGFSQLGKSLAPVKVSGTPIKVPDALKGNTATPFRMRTPQVKKATGVPVMRNRLNQLGY